MTDCLTKTRKNDKGLFNVIYSFAVTNVLYFIFLTLLISCCTTQYQDQTGFELKFNKKKKKLEIKRKYTAAYKAKLNKGK